MGGERGRPDPLTILAEQDKTRLAELIPLRYGRMSRTPFTFLRGAAAVMASDLAAGARTVNVPDTVGYAVPGKTKLV